MVGYADRHLFLPLSVSAFPLRNAIGDDGHVSKRTPYRLSIPIALILQPIEDQVIDTQDSTCRLRFTVRHGQSSHASVRHDYDELDTMVTVLDPPPSVQSSPQLTSSRNWSYFGTLNEFTLYDLDLVNEIHTSPGQKFPSDAGGLSSPNPWYMVAAIVPAGIRARSSVKRCDRDGLCTVELHPSRREEYRIIVALGLNDLLSWPVPFIKQTQPVSVCSQNS